MENAPSSLRTTAAQLLSKFAVSALILILTLFFSTFCVSCTTARSVTPYTSPRVQFLNEIEPDSDSSSGSGSGDDEYDYEFEPATNTPNEDILGSIVINNQIGPKTLALGYFYAAGQFVFFAIIIIVLILYYRRYVLATALIVQRQMLSSEAATRKTFTATVVVPPPKQVTPCNCSCRFEEMVFYYTTSVFMALVGIILLLTALVRLANWIVDQIESRSSRRAPLPPPLDYVGPCAEDHIYDEPHNDRVPELGQYMQMK